MAKKRINRRDLTERNLHAEKKRLTRAMARIAALEHDMSSVERRVVALERTVTALTTPQQPQPPDQA